MSDTESIMQASKQKTFLVLCLLVSCRKAGFQIGCPKMSKWFFCLFMLISIKYEKSSISEIFLTIVLLLPACTTEVSQPCTWFLLNTNGDIIKIFQLNSPKKSIILWMPFKNLSKITPCSWVRGGLFLVMVSSRQ